MEVKQKLAELSSSGHVVRPSDVIDDDDDDLVITRVFQGKSQEDPHSENKYSGGPAPFTNRRAALYLESAVPGGQTFGSVTDERGKCGKMQSNNKFSRLRQELVQNKSVSGGDTWVTPAARVTGKTKIKFSVSEVGEPLQIEDLEDV